MLPRPAYAALLALYALTLAVITLTPTTGETGGNWVPFGQIVAVLRGDVRLYSAGQLLGNIALFVPFGWLLPVLWDRLRSFGRIVALAAACSATIEIVQLLFLTGRSPATDDVILNTTGAFVGAFMFFAAREA